MIYAEDSFFTLGSGGRVALVCLTVVLSAFCLWLVWYLAEGFGRFTRVLLSLALLWLFLWVSPQAYYMLYYAIIDGLPLQWVVQSPPTPIKLAKLMSFTDRATLSEHGQGVLGWMMMIVALLRRRPRTD